MLEYHRFLMSRVRRLPALLVVALLVVASACAKSPAAPSDPAAAPLVITAQPQSQAVTRGSSATLSVAASGADAISYQWYIGTSGETSTPVAGATASSYSTPALTTTTRYWVRASAGTSAADSATATVAVDVVAPSIVEPPENETIAPGETAYLFVETEGTAPFTYQWFRGESGSTADPVDDATAWEFTTPALTETTRFWVRVSNDAGSADSVAATVTVTTAAPPSPPAPPPPPPGTPPPPPPPPPSTPPADPSAAAFEDEVLVLVNQQRAAGATCGSTTYAPVGALYMNANLRTAARGHSQDMATQNYFSHTSLDGRTFSQRMDDAGYSGSGPRGENIGAGYSSPAAVVNGWMGSVGHCQNIMNGGFRAAGVGYGYGAGSTYGRYWTLALGGS